MSLPENNQAIEQALKAGTKLPLALTNYPSRGQTAVQELYATSLGKLFLKRTNERNLKECQINAESATLAEREYWAYRLAKHLGLAVPQMYLLDTHTTVQQWFDIPDARQYATHHGPLSFTADNIFDCAIFDWFTGQIDRHDANYLYDFTQQQIILIDSAHGFLRYEGSLPDYLKLYEASLPAALTRNIASTIHKTIINLKPDTLQSLVPLRSVDERVALVQRQQKLGEVQNIADVLALYRGTA